MMFVVETCDRECLGVTPVEDRAHAKRVMDELLKGHCEQLGCLEEYDAYESAVPPAEWPPKMHLDDPSSGESGAWCNLKGFQWDAFPTALTREAEDELFRILSRERAAREDEESHRQ